MTKAKIDALHELFGPELGMTDDALKHCDIVYEMLLTALTELRPPSIFRKKTTATVVDSFLRQSLKICKENRLTKEERLGFHLAVMRILFELEKRDVTAGSDNRGH